MSVAGRPLKLVLPWSSVTALGPDDRRVLIPHAGRDHDLLGKRLFSDAGVELGTVTDIDAERLVRLAERHDVTVVLECVPGDHVVHGDPVGRITRRGRTIRGGAPPGPRARAGRGAAQPDDDDPTAP